MANLDKIPLFSSIGAALEYLKGKPAVAGPVLYVYLIVIGLISDSVLFGEFGINIFDFSEFSDFVFSPIKRLFESLIVFGLAIVAIFIYLNFILIIIRSWGEDSAPFKNTLIFLFAIFFIGLSIIVPISVAKFSADNIKNGIGHKADITLKGVQQIDPYLIQEAFIIGATDKFLFVYQKCDANKKSATFALPVANIQKMKVSFSAPTGPWDRFLMVLNREKKNPTKCV